MWELCRAGDNYKLYGLTFGFVYMLQFASAIRDPGRYREYKMGAEKYGQWFEGGITVKDGKR
ncbi:MAG: hypothetical protein WD696_03690 [Bryobacteraceae bacterium]